jgi:acetyl-CoA carboxylase biotin carboxylase subunit
VSPNYDSLLAKVIVWAPDRAQALARMQRALGELRVEGRGLATTAGFHQAILRDPTFRAGEHAIDFVDTFMNQRKGGDRTSEAGRPVSLPPIADS